MADHPLRRWKRFLAAFSAIDAAIEAAGPDISRDEFRRARCVIVERLCDASDEDVRDELCRCLDSAMVQSLLTLQMVPVAPAMLARTELVPAVRALRRHECEQVRGLAEDIVSGWSATVEGDLVKVRAATDRLAQIDQRIPPAADTDDVVHSEHGALPSRLVTNTKAGSKETTAFAIDTRHAASVSSESTKVSVPPLRRTTTSRVSESSGSADRGVSCNIDDKIEASKRRLREGYREEEDAKRQRKIQFIKKPDMVRDRKKQHPIMRERSRVRHASSVKVRCGFRAP